jgi:dihydrolipoamide dehydrogenase
VSKYGTYVTLSLLSPRALYCSGLAVRIPRPIAHGELRGVHLVGADVAELLPELTLAQRWDLTVEELVPNVHTHPTLSAVLQETFRDLTGKMINL